MTIMNKWTQFQDYCATQGIPHEITALGYEFTEDQFTQWCVDRKEVKNNLFPAFDFGKYEYSELVTVEQGVETIKAAVMAMLQDYDSRGRSLARTRLKQLLKNSDKHLNYRICKTYYLWLGKHHGNATESDNKSMWAFGCIDAYTYDIEFGKLWSKQTA